MNKSNTAKTYKDRFNFDYTLQLYGIVSDETYVHLLAKDNQIVLTLAISKEEALEKFEQMGVPKNFLRKELVIKLGLRPGKASKHYLYNL